VLRLRVRSASTNAIERMPELGFTITSVGQRQIELLHVLIRDVSYNWDILKTCIDADPVNTNALEFSEKLRRLSLIVEKFFPVYVDAVKDINKGNIWKRYKYRDHRASYTSCSDGRHLAALSTTTTVPSGESNRLCAGRTR
jgi:hypothetical protein